MSVSHDSKNPHRQKQVQFSLSRLISRSLSPVCPDSNVVGFLQVAAAAEELDVGVRIAATF